MKIGILGIAVESGNRGVAALGSSLYTLFKNNGAETVEYLGICRPGAEFIVREDGAKASAPVNFTRVSFKSGAWRNLFVNFAAAAVYRISPEFVRNAILSKSSWLRSIHSSDVVGDIRGGDSFSDIYGFPRFVYGFLAACTVIFLEKPIVFLPQTYGPFKGTLARKMAAFLLRSSTVVIARDTRSRAVAETLLPSGRDVLLSPDVAFALEPESPAHIEIEPSTPGFAGKTVGVNVNGLMYNGGYTGGNQFGLALDYPEYVQKLVAGLVDAGAERVLLVPHTYAPVGDVESDNEACSKVRAALAPGHQEKVAIVTGDYDQCEIKGIIGTCDFFIGSRMHSCIAALSQGVPCVGVAYSMKFAGVFESVGMLGWVVEAREHDTASALTETLRLYGAREDARGPLRAAAAASRGRLDKAFAGIIRAVDQRAAEGGITPVSLAELQES